MLNKFTYGLVAMMIMPVAASAQSVEFTGAELSYNYQESDDDYSADTRRISLEARIIGQVVTQLDFFNNGYDGDVDYGGYAIHLGYAPAPVPGLVAGVFYNEDDWEGDYYSSQGLEAVYETGPFSAEVAFGTYEELASGSSFAFDFAQLDASYRVLDQVALTAHFVQAEGDENVDVLGFGARVDLTDDIYLELSSRQMDGDFEQGIFGVEIGYLIGSGTTFGARDWNGIFSIY